MFYYDRTNPHVLFMDIREEERTLQDGYELCVKPDVIGDFRNIPFPDESFQMVVFDPPHLHNLGKNSIYVAKYGKLNRRTWQEDISLGFAECFRVLKPHGILNFKWNETQFKADDVIPLSPYNPLFGNRTDKTKTIWFTFIKEPEMIRDGEQLSLFDVFRT